MRNRSFCPSCGRDGVIVTATTAWGVICKGCEARARREDCSLCGQFRHVGRRNPDGSSTCSACAHRAEAAATRAVALDFVVAAIAAVEPHLSRSVVRDAVDKACNSKGKLASLADALRSERNCLTSGSTGAPRGADRVVAALQDVGATGLRLPTCAVCGRSTPSLQGRTGRRVCTRCEQAARLEVCGRCAKLRPVATRAEDKTAVCARCLQLDQARWETCAGCGRLANVRSRGEAGPLCGNCHRRRQIAECTMCGEGPSLQWDPRRPAGVPVLRRATSSDVLVLWPAGSSGGGVGGGAGLCHLLQARTAVQTGM